MIHKFKLTLLAVFASLMLVIAGTGTASAAECKGLSKSSCQSNQQCSFVKAHSRSDGTKVKAFCRSKPGQGVSKASERKSTNKAKAAEKKATKTKKKTAKKVADDDSKSAKKTTKKAKKKSTKKKAKKTKKKSGSSS
ncbi:MAG: hypothetical protein ACR2OM_08460 [Aestuariivirgaceae bacterium]